MKFEEIKFSAQYTDEEIVELAKFFTEEQEKRSVQQKKIKKLEDDYKKLLELFPETRFCINIDTGYRYITVDVLELLDYYFNDKDYVCQLIKTKL